MGIYCEKVFPWLFEKMGDEPKELMERLRRETLRGLHGNVLELGFGVGFNLSRYPAEVASVTALEPSAGMLRKARKYISASLVPVTVVAARGESLPFKEASFDGVVSTLTLCSVGDPARTLAEVRRVLVPGGAFYFLEHVASCDKGEKALQDFFNPLSKVIFCGCNLNRNTEAAIAQAGFRLEEVERFRLREQGVPGFLSSMVRGVCRS